MGVFAIVVVTLVLMNLADQTRIQNFLTIYRIVALIIMITTLLIKVTADGHDVVSARMRNIGLFNWSKFAKGFGPTLLAITCQYNMPDALQPLDVKEEARWATFSALLLSSAFYVLLATLGALGFDEVNPLVSLNWAEYTACGSGWEECGLNKHGEDKQKTIATLVQLLVLLFPLLNVTSAYPMIGITMGCYRQYGAISHHSITDDTGQYHIKTQPQYRTISHHRQYRIITRPQYRTIPHHNTTTIQDNTLLWYYHNAGQYLIITQPQYRTIPHHNTTTIQDNIIKVLRQYGTISHYRQYRINVLRQYGTISHHSITDNTGQYLIITQPQYRTISHHSIKTIQDNISL
eukprot:g14034.t1